MAKNLILLGIVLILAGLLWPWLAKIPFGRLPGDIIIKREDFRFYFPLASCLLVSLVVSLLFWLFKK